MPTKRKEVMNMDMITLKNVQKSEGIHKVLKDVNLNIRQGEIYGLIGKNGFVVPNMVKERIRSYELSDFTKQNEKEIKKLLK